MTSIIQEILKIYKSQWEVPKEKDPPYWLFKNVMLFIDHNMDYFDGKGPENNK